MEEKLKNPIKEIILSVSFSRDLEVNKLESFCDNDIIKKDFPVFIPGYDATVKFGENPSSEFSHTGFILKSDEEEKNKNILSIKLGKVSYHIINRYESFDVILDQLDEYWNALQEPFNDLPITVISARYINQINIFEGEKYEDYINVGINTPFKKVHGQFVNFSLSHDSNIKSNVIIANKTMEVLILDIIVEKAIDKVSVKNVSDLFIELRPIKNDIFQKLVTQKTKDKFEIL